jgi:hypothetical protein
MTIQLDGGTTIDEAVVRHIDGATTFVESEFDAVKFYGGWGVNPQLTVVNPEGIDLTVHSFDTDLAEWHIPLHTIVFETGLYQLRFLNTSELEVPCMILEDTYLGDFYDIEEGTELELMMYDTTYATRFILHLGRTYERMRENVTCNGEFNGSFELFLDTDEDVSYELFWGDAIEVGVGNGNPLMITDLEAASYDLVIYDLEAVCDEHIFHFSVIEPNSMVLTSEITEEVLGNDGQVLLEITGGRDPYTFEWSNGEITKNIYDLMSGNYTVEVIDANECSFEETFSVGSVLSANSTIHSNDYAIYYDPILNQLNIENGNTIRGKSLELYDMQGSLIKQYDLMNTDSKQIFVIPEALSSGIYLIKLGQNSDGFRFVK